MKCISDYRTGDELVPGSPSFEPDAEYDERMEQIREARLALDEAEEALDSGSYALCDQHMADAMSALVPA